VSYVRSLPAVAGTSSEFRVPVVVRFLYAAGMIKDAAEKIDHSLPPAQPFASNDEIAHGAYVAAACKGCHNEFLMTTAVFCEGAADCPWRRDRHRELQA
jgi:hypothetical protein